MKIKMAATCIIVVCCAAVLCIKSVSFADTTDSSTTRKKLFLIERQLSRGASKTEAKEALIVDYKAAFTPEKLKQLVEEAFNESEVAKPDNQGKSKEEGTTQDFGSVTAKLEGGL